MPLFTSDRERRLWLWTLVVLVAIYSSLGLARTLAGALRDQGLLVGFFVLGLLLVGATILTQGFKVRPGGVEITVALGITAAYLMVFTRMATPEERTHLIEYGVLAIFIYEALTERGRNGHPVPVVPLFAVLATAAFGIFDEIIQAYLPSRVFDPIDILFNVIAGVIAVVASVVLAWARRSLGRN